MMEVVFTLPEDQLQDLDRWAVSLGVSPSEALSKLLEYVELDWLAFYASGDR